MSNMIRTKLSVMMFLEFFIWGAWLPLIFGYLPSLGFNSLQQSWILNAFALASFVGMFFSNQFADRNFAAERFLAVSQLIGGLAILALAFTTNFWAFFLLMLVHCLFYVPTISITNSIAFANLKDPQHDFGPVRLWGTIGWIAASWPFVFILVDWASVAAQVAASDTDVSALQWLGMALGTSKQGAALQEGVRWTFIASGIASLLLAGFSLVLPHTPPKPAVKGAEQFAWLEAMKLLAVPFVLVLFVVTFFDACVHQCYFIWTNDYLKSVGIPANWVMPVMSIGQIAEIGTMAILGICLKRLGWRNIMVLGILGHAVRFGVFSLLPMPWLAITVNVLHGICYAFFFATVYIFVDEFFPKDARTSAQGLFNFLILGFGPFVANFIWPMVGDIVRTVDVQSAVVRDGDRHELIVSGMVKNPASADGKLELVQRDQQGAEVSRVISLNANHSFRESFGEAVPGEYSYHFKTIRKSIVRGDAEIKVSVPPLKVGDALSGIPEKELPTTAVRDHDFQSLFLYPSGMAIFAALLLLIFFRPPASKADAAGAVALSH
jgi:nucleoside transporter